MRAKNSVRTRSAYHFGRRGYAMILNYIQGTAVDSLISLPGLHTFTSEGLGPTCQFIILRSFYSPMAQSVVANVVLCAKLEWQHRAHSAVS